MKRYWKVITLCIVPVIVIATFYIQSSLATENAKIEFEKISGNQAEVENLFIYGDYVAGNMHQSLKISNKETINLEDQSLLQELKRGNTLPVFKNLIDQHKNFMRGKDYMPNSFYENKNLLAYASISREDSYVSAENFSLDIEVLNKEKEETTSIQLDVPKWREYKWVDVLEVQAKGEQLKVFIQGLRTDGGKNLSVYTIDIDEQKIVNDKLIHTAPAVENGWSDIRIANDFYSIQPQKYFLIKREAYEDQTVKSGGEIEMEGEPNIASNDLYIYNVENNQLEEFIAPDEILGVIDSASIINSTIFIPSLSANGLDVYQYDIENDKWGKKQTFDVVHTENDEGAPFVKIINGKIYFISSAINSYNIYIGDLKEGNLLYEGKIKVNGQRANDMDDHLYIHEIEIVQ